MRDCPECGTDLSQPPYDDQEISRLRAENEQLKARVKEERERGDAYQKLKRKKANRCYELTSQLEQAQRAQKELAEAVKEFANLHGYHDCDDPYCIEVRVDRLQRLQAKISELEFQNHLLKSTQKVLLEEKDDDA